MSNNKPLIVFDVNGVLCHRHKIAHSYLGTIPQEDISREPKVVGARHLRLPNFKVFIRPGVVELLKRLAVDYDIGFWSSGTYLNMNSIVTYFIQQTSITPKFTWYRSQCVRDPEPITNHSTIKPVSRLLAEGIVTDANQVYFVDDSPSKLRFNNPDNCIIVSKYNPTLSKSVESPDPIEDISSIVLEKLGIS